MNAVPVLQQEAVGILNSYIRQFSAVISDGSSLSPRVRDVWSLEQYTSYMDIQLGIRRQMEARHAISNLSLGANPYDGTKFKKKQQAI